ncbi:MAG: 6,7-dimethyl-8-ribityllumazine synthase [Ignavibacteriota bacterium]
MSARIKGSSSGTGHRIAIVVSRFNSEITEGLLRGALRALIASDISESRIETIEVPGAFEIPFALESLASSKKYDALVALGCVIKGETAHFEYISRLAMDGMNAVMLKYGIPVSCGLLTTYTEEQAIARSGDNEENKGSEAALTAVEMANLAKLLRS